MPWGSEVIAKLAIHKCVSFPFNIWHFFALLIKRIEAMQKLFIKTGENNFGQNPSKTVTHFESGKHLFYSLSIWWIYAGFFHSKIRYVEVVILKLRNSSIFWFEQVWQAPWNSLWGCSWLFYVTIIWCLMLFYNWIRNLFFTPLSHLIWS